MEPLPGGVFALLTLWMVLEVVVVALGLVDALPELEVAFHAPPRLLVVPCTCLRPGWQPPPARALPHFAFTAPLHQGGGHACWPGRFRTVSLCAVSRAPRRANTTEAVIWWALSGLLCEPVGECPILSPSVWQLVRSPSPLRVALVWRPQTWSADHLARSAVSPNVESTAVARRIPVSVVGHWVAASPVWLGTPRLPPAESFPGGVVAPWGHRSKQIQRGGIVLPPGAYQPSVGADLASGRAQLPESPVCLAWTAGNLCPHSWWFAVWGQSPPPAVLHGAQLYLGYRHGLPGGVFHCVGAATWPCLGALRCLPH